MCCAIPFQCLSCHYLLVFVLSCVTVLFCYCHFLQCLFFVFCYTVSVVVMCYSVCVVVLCHDFCVVAVMVFVLWMCCVHWRIAAMNLSKQLKGNSGSGSSRKNSFRAPVMTWISSHWPSSRSRCSSAEDHSVNSAFSQFWDPVWGWWCVYRGRLCAAVSGSRPGSRSLCRSRPHPDLKKI